MTMRYTNPRLLYFTLQWLLKCGRSLSRCKIIHTIRFSAIIAYQINTAIDLR